VKCQLDRIPRLARAGLCALALVALLIAAVGPAGAQQATPASPLAVRFTGVLTLAGRPAPRGTTLQAITARNAHDFVVCGTGRVVDANGDYVLDVPVNRSTGSAPAIQNRTDRCLAASAGSTTYVFVARGENVGGCASNAVLDDPTTWGQVIPCNLQGLLPTAAPVAAAAVGAFPMPLAHFFGTLTLGNQPAPPGTKLQAEAVPGSGAPVACGKGSVYDDRGDYLVDVPASAPAGCASATVPRSTTYVFLVGGVNVGSCAIVATLDDPTTLGHVVTCNLYVASQPGGAG